MDKYKNKKVLITGASGFIGSSLSKGLLMLEAIVIGISRIEQKSDNGIIWFKGDLSDFHFVEDVIKKVQPDYVYHLASHVLGSREFKHVYSTFNDNVVSTLNLLSVLYKYPCKRIILAGSFEENSINYKNSIPNSPYAAAKIASSNYAKMFYTLYKMPICLTSIYMVYGPGQKDITKLIPYVILKTLNGETPKLSNGNRKIDWIYIDDVIEGLITMMHSPNIEGKTVALGSGKYVSIKKTVNQLTKMIDSSIVPKFGAIKERQLELKNKANIEKTLQKIGWKTSTKLKDGLEKTINHYHNYNKNNLTSN